MPEISVRGLEMPESPIRKLAPLAVAAKNAEQKFITSISDSLTYLHLRLRSMRLKRLTVAFSSIHPRKAISAIAKNW
jgi:hypothetical protein